AAITLPFFLRGALAPERAIIPPLPPAPAGSIGSASTLIPAHWSQTTPAKCAPRHQTLPRQSPRPPTPETKEYSHPSMPAAPAPHYSAAYLPPEQHAKSPLPPPTPPPNGPQ